MHFGFGIYGRGLPQRTVLGYALLLFGSLLALGGSEAAAQPYQVHDLRDLPSVLTSSDPTPVTVFDGLLYYVTDDGRHGRELWRTDGTEAGTTLLRDVWPGEASGTGVFAWHAGPLFYTLYDGPFVGREMWRSDGTAAGTFAVGDVFPGTGFASVPEGISYVSPLMLFGAEDGVHDYALWSSDGTPGGAAFVADIAPLPDAVYGDGGEVIAAGAIFAANDGVTGQEPWVSDGTAGGTFQLADINAGPDFGHPWYFTTFQNRVYFSANSSTFGREPWSTDGTVAGTTLLKDIDPMGNSSTPREFTPVGNTLFFSAEGELWKSDGTSLGTVQVADLNGASASNPYELEDLQGTLIFAATTAAGTELWKSDGTAAGTTMILDINPGAGSSDPENLLAIGGEVFFVADDGTAGRELWVTDGTAGGTSLVRDIRPGLPSSDPARFQAYDGKLYFNAEDPARGNELFVSDGTTAGTQIVLEQGKDDGSSPQTLVRRGEDVFFRAVDNSTKMAIWVSDGTAAGTRRLGGGQGDLGGYSKPEALVQVGDVVYFAADRTASGTEIYRTDGTFAGTVRISDMSGGALNEMIYNGGELFFDLNTSAGREPWVSDGTMAGTQILLDINPGSGSSNPLGFAPVGSSVVFHTQLPGSGPELWVSDGTAAGTSPIADLSTGAAGTRLEEMTPALGKVFFTAKTNSGRELWVTDGTAAGTFLVKDIYPGNQFAPDPQNLTPALGRLFFIADDGTNGYEVWSTDGTNAGTQMVVDINPTDSFARPVILGEYKSKVWFVAYDGTDANLYATDGTALGTTSVLTLHRDAVYGTPRGGQVFDDLLYFSTWTLADGIELWVTDGTAAGTALVSDLDSGNLSSEPEELTVTEGLLFFAAADSAVGRELWALPSENLIFFDDLETGDASRWDDETLLGATTSYNAAAADRGETGLEIALDADNERAFLTDETPDGEDFYRVRFRFDPNSITLAENKRFKIVSSRSDTGERLFQALVRWRMSEGFTIRAKAHRNDLAWDGTSWHPLADDWSELEIAWRRSSAPSASDGLLRLSIDGVLIEEVTGIDNDLWPTDWVQWGIVGGVEPGTNGSVFFDDFSSWRGPVP